MLSRLRFLPTFFAFLIVAFAFAVVVRVRSFQQDVNVDHSRRTVTTATASRAVTDSGDEPALRTETIAAPQSAGATAEQERERRYRELLNASKGSETAQPPPSARPSLLARVVAPIVNAFGGHKAATPAAGQPKSTNAVTLQTSAAGHDVKKPAATDTADPNSDTTPPQLLGAEFVPTTIHDGEFTQLTITATDDQSGVRAAAGNISGPGGTLQGFALEREGETNRWSGRIAIPKSSAEGQWHINFLSLTDAASNTATLGWKQGLIPSTATFRVISSKPDTTPPTLKSVALEKVSMRVGDKNSLLIDADDDQSGLNLVSGVFVSPSKFARVSFACRNQDGTLWQCDIAPPANADCGDWQLEQIQLQDKANNLAVIRTDNPLIAAVRLTISSDGCDSTPPIVQSVLLDTAVVTAPGTVTLTIVASDDVSGVANINGHMVFTGTVAAGNQPPRLYFSCRPAGEGQWIGTISIPPKAARGIWRIGAIQVMDKAGNLKQYSSADPVAANVILRVQ